MFYSTRPNIYKFIVLLNSVRKYSCIKFVIVVKYKKIRRKICKKEEFLSKQIINYENNLIIRFE